jgi:transcription initiation factor TFIIH subunit 4
MRKEDPVVPESVIDQIRLWEGERNCLGWKSGSLFQNFDPKTEVKLFEETVAFAKLKGVLVWESRQSLLLFVAGDNGHEIVRQFIKEKTKEKK